MKRIFTVLFAVILTAILWAQSPQKMSYQAVIRDASDNLVTSQNVGMQISILQGSIYGAAIYVETHSLTTNANGLVSLEIGTGTVLNGDFTNIDWANGSYFIKTETDPAGGTSFSITGTSQLLSVPYALHAKTAESFTGIITETDPIFTSSQAAYITANDITKLSNLSGTNSGDQDLSGLATIASLNLKVDKETGKGLSSNDFTTVEQTKLAAITGINTGDQALSVSSIGDTLYLSNSNWVIIPGISASNQITVTVTDIDGNVYKTVKIGNQVWMAENLKTTKYADGTVIPLVTENSAWNSLSTPGYSWYVNDESTYKETYGALYNWYTVNTGKLCPTGWHVPTDAEWTTLNDFLGGESVAGGKLKEVGISHWNSPNTDATDEFGFKALPGGTRHYTGTYSMIGDYCSWLSSTEYYSNSAWNRTLNNTSGVLGRANHVYKRDGQSVRCVKD